MKMNEPMSDMTRNRGGELPEGWRVTTIGTVVELNPPKPKQDALASDSLVSFVPMSAVDAASGAITQSEAREFAAVRKGYTAFRDNDVIFAKITPCMENGKAAIARDLINKLGFGSTEFHVLRSCSDILPEYIYNFIRQESFRAAAEAEMTGSVGQKRVPSDFLTNAIIPLPPLPEQHRIVAKIDELLTQVNAVRVRLERVAAMLKRFRQAVLSAACSGKLTEGWREEQGLAPELDSVLLSTVAADFRYGSAAKSQAEGSVPVLRMGNIQDGRLIWDDLVFTSDNAEIGKYQLHPGDVLFNRTNSPELVGKTALYKGERPAIYAGYLIRIRCSSELLPDYLNYCLNSPAGREYCWQVKTDGVSQSNINAKKLAAFEFQLPSVGEQHEIVRRVESLFALADRIESRVAAASARAERLTQAILAKAFRGELVPTEAELGRLPQEPTVEPEPLPEGTSGTKGRGKKAGGKSKRGKEQLPLFG